MMKDEHYLIAFESINHANYLESELKKYGHRVDTVQTPEYLTNDYYLALKVNRKALEAAYEKIIEINLEKFRIYKHFIRNGKKTYKLVMKDDEDLDKGFLNMLFDQENKGYKVNERKQRLKEAIDRIDAEEVIKKDIIIAKESIKEKIIPMDEGSAMEIKVVKNSASNDEKDKRRKRKKLDPIELIEGLYKLRQKKNRIN
ncbi:DUF3343 domain-containing protein [Wukongibacter baidiensis]|uniref:DUF3343 domain-containing protein n=1 Tax=Wukongibacter baidiensis TaxID=1723361 RepID=UPI003D7F1EB7